PCATAPSPGKRRCRRRPPWLARTARRPNPRPKPPDVCFNSRPDAEDEDPLREQEAVPKDRGRQAPRPARLLEPHSREEVAEAQAAHGPAHRGRRARPRARAYVARREGALRCPARPTPSRGGGDARRSSPRPGAIGAASTRAP